MVSEKPPAQRGFSRSGGQKSSEKWLENTWMTWITGSSCLKRGQSRRRWPGTKAGSTWLRFTALSLATRTGVMVVVSFAEKGPKSHLTSVDRTVSLRSKNQKQNDRLAKTGSGQTYLRPSTLKPRRTHYCVWSIYTCRCAWRWRTS